MVRVFPVVILSATNAICLVSSAESYILNNPSENSVIAVVVDEPPTPLTVPLKSVIPPVTIFILPARA